MSGSPTKSGKALALRVVAAAAALVQAVITVLSALDHGWFVAVIRYEVIVVTVLAVPAIAVMTYAALKQRSLKGRRTSYVVIYVGLGWTLWAQLVGPRRPIDIVLTFGSLIACLALIRKDFSALGRQERQRANGLVALPAAAHVPTDHATANWVGRYARDVLDGLSVLPGLGRIRRYAHKLDRLEIRGLAALLLVALLTLASLGGTALAVAESTRPDPVSTDMPIGNPGDSGESGEDKEVEAKHTKRPMPLPTYEMLCKAFGRPGDPAPEPQRTRLEEQVVGRGGLGAIQAGCLENATVLPNGLGLWMAEGVCGDELRSLALAGPARGVIVLQEAARFARELAGEGVLLGLRERVAVATGDMVLIESMRGLYVLVRRESERGMPPVTEPRRCDEIQGENVKYTIVPPALVPLWLALIAVHGWVWPIVDTTWSQAGDAFAFQRDGDDGPSIVGNAACVDDLKCTLFWASGVQTQVGGGSATAEQLLFVAPEPA